MEYRHPGLLDICHHDPSIFNPWNFIWNEGGFQSGPNHIRIRDFNHIDSRVCQRRIFSALFVFGLKWLPGTSSMSSGFEFRQLILPALVLIVYDFGYVARMTRASMAEVMTSQYIRTAVLKGLPYRRVIFKHALRNALIAPFTVIMLQINWLLSGVIVVEFFFAYKGFGALLLEASLNNDIALLEACAMVAVVVAVGSQTIADIGYTFLNPRIRFS